MAKPQYDEDGKEVKTPHVECEFRWESKKYSIPIQANQPGARAIIPQTCGEIVQLHNITPQSNGSLLAQTVVAKAINDPAIPLIGTARRVTTR